MKRKFVQPMPTPYRVIRGLCFVGLLLLTFAVASAQKTKTPTPLVTTLVHDHDSTGNLLLMRSDDYNGSGEATYTTTTTKHGSLTSWLPNGEWDLSLATQSLRTLWITPNDPVGSQPAGPPAGYYWDGVQSISHCFDQKGNIVPLPNILTSSGNCTLEVNFISGSFLYKLLMSPFPFSGAGDIQPTCPSTGCPPTGVVTVTCNEVSNGECISWTIVPNTSAPNANVANLYSLGGTWLFIGQYNNTFRIDVTNP